MTAFAEKTRLYTWGLVQLGLKGRPDVSLGFLGGIGDDLLCTAPIDEWLRRGARRVWFFTRHPALYRYDRRVRLIPEDARYRHLARGLGRPMRSLSYSDFDPASDRDPPPAEHLVAAMCRQAGLSGEISLRPHLPLSDEERSAAARFHGLIAIHTSTLAASVPMRNKQWRTDRLQAVVDHLGSEFRFVQIGAPGDPLLEGVLDMRGRTSLRETAAILGQARLFVGLAGFLMHLARAVDCPSVIVYGGREVPGITGYICNENVTSSPPCAPCWQRNRCDHAHVCMEEIGADTVIAALKRMLSRPRGPLDCQTASL